MNRHAERLSDKDVAVVCVACSHGWFARPKYPTRFIACPVCGRSNKIGTDVLEQAQKLQEEAAKMQQEQHDAQIENMKAKAV